jgi:DNA-binding SARP family transcriptional activator/tetratricopeptide (TPR) repeat protein
MICRMLGPLEVRAGESWTGVSAPKWRTLLAVLLLHPGQVVSMGQLADEVWGTHPPPGARKLVSGYVARLRQLIGDPDGRVLETRAPGYRLMVVQSDLDVSRFEQLVAVARVALDEADGSRAGEYLAEALALWRGPALADVPRGPLVAAEAARLDELRLDAMELRVEAGICCGRAAELVAELRQLTAGYPLRERFWHQLMRALEQGGRPAEALEVYAQARKVLAEELGADPGPRLQELHRRLLAADPAPAAVAAAGPSAVTVAAPAVLRQLPATAAHFADRSAELAALIGLLDQVGAELPGTVVISAIDGMPGVGKTTLAVQAAHLVADRFPDRQLFVDLHGHTPGQEPADPADVLAALLAADGVDPRYLPAGLDGRAAMWRDRMAGRRALLILDNARGSAQVAPLLPGTAGCLVIVTSRRFLGDLPAAVELSLDVLPPGSARAMFTALAPRARNDPDRVAELVTLCGYLPLAISLLARLFARHRSWRMADLITETRVRLLTVTAENRTVAAAFEASYQDLDAGRQRFFRRLGLHPGAEIDAYAAAALAGVPLAEAATHLDALHGDRLLEEPIPRRYRMHDLIRQYARSLAAGEPADQRERAAGRLLDYYQHTAMAADAHLARYTRSATAAPITAPASAPRLPGRDQAQAWMTSERANLMGCIGYAAEHQEDRRVAGLTGAIAAHLRGYGPWPQAITLHAAAVGAARRLGDQPGEAGALLDLGDVQCMTSDYPAATSALEQALAIFRSVGDRLGQANARYLLGVVRQQSAADFPAATGLLEQALVIFRSIGDRRGEANALSSMGAVRRLAGDYPEATAVLEQALDIFRGIGSLTGEANALRSLGAVRQLTADYPGATRLLEEALGISRRIGERLGEAYALFALGAVRQLAGDYSGATRVLEDSLDIFRGIGSRIGEAYALQNLSDARRGAGDYPTAIGLLEQSLASCRDIGDRIGEAYGLLGLGGMRRLTGDFPRAASLLEQSLSIFRDIGDRGGEAGALIETGATRLAQGDPLEARACYQAALELACATGAQLEEARALEGIGKCAAQIRDADGAQSALQQALAIYQRLGAADAARLAAELGLSATGRARPRAPRANPPVSTPA